MPERSEDQQSQQHHEQLTQLHANVKGQQRQDVFAVRQADFAEHTRKAEAMKQAEAEDHAIAQALAPNRAVFRRQQFLEPDVDDRSGNEGLYKISRQVDHAKRGERQRQGVRDRETGHQQSQLTCSAADEKESQHEQHVIESQRQNVLEAEKTIDKEQIEP